MSDFKVGAFVKLRPDFVLNGSEKLVFSHSVEYEVLEVYTVEEMLRLRGINNRVRMRPFVVVPPKERGMFTLNEYGV